MARFLFYTDVHLSGRNPRHRIDDFPTAILCKLVEIYEIAKSEECEFVLFGGDMFNAHRIFSFPVLARAMDAVCDSELVTYAIVGQHEIYGYNPKTLESSTLGFFVSRCPRYQLVWEPVVVGTGEVRLHSCHVWEDLMVKEPTTPDGCVNVLMAHCLLSDRKRAFETIQTKDFGESERCNYCLVLSGDLHCGFEAHKHRDTWFVNPGAIARKAMDEISRNPQIAVIDISRNSIPKIKYVELQSAKPGNEVFGQTFLELVREMEDFDASDFVNEMDKFEMEAIDVHDLIQKVGEQQKVRSEVLTYLASKKEA